MTNTTLVFDVEGNNFLPGLTTMWCIGIADIADSVVGPMNEHFREPGDFTVGTRGYYLCYDGAYTHVVKVYSDEDPDFLPLQEGLDRLSTADKLVAHNGIGYDFFAINKLYPNTIRREQMWDSMVACSLLDPERRSHAIASYGTEYGMPKGDFKEFERWSRQMADPYMIRDVVINARIYMDCQAAFRAWLAKGVDFREALALEMQVAFVLAIQSQHGFRLDMDHARDLEATLRDEYVNAERSLQNVFLPRIKPKKARWCMETRNWVDVDSPVSKSSNRSTGRVRGIAFTPIEVQMFNAGSRQQIAERLSAMYGWRPTQFTPAGSPKVDETVLTNLDYPEAEALKVYLRIGKMLGQLVDGKGGWLKQEIDGRIHGFVKSCGCRTHRMSHNSPNVAQVDKDKRMRSCWVADEGEVMVGCDASGLELRELGHYLARWDGGAYGAAAAVSDEDKANGALDAHTMNMNALGMYNRNNVKTFFYAMIYGSGDENLGNIVIKDAKQAGKPIPKGAPRTVGRNARLKLETGIVGLGELVKLAKEADKNRKFVKAHDGRAIRTNGQHSALNTLLQGSGAVTMKKALVLFHFDLCRKQGLTDEFDMPVGWGYLANVHDEVQFSCEPGIAEKLGSLFRDSIILAGEKLNLRTPMDGEFMIGNNWSETH